MGKDQEVFTFSGRQFRKRVKARNEKICAYIDHTFSDEDIRASSGATGNIANLKNCEAQSSER